MYNSIGMLMPDAFDTFSETVKPWNASSSPEDHADAFVVELENLLVAANGLDHPDLVTEALLEIHARALPEVVIKLHAVAEAAGMDKVAKLTNFITSKALLEMHEDSEFENTATQGLIRAVRRIPEQIRKDTINGLVFNVMYGNALLDTYWPPKDNALLAQATEEVADDDIFDTIYFLEGYLKEHKYRAEVASELAHGLRADDFCSQNSPDDPKPDYEAVLIKVDERRHRRVASIQARASELLQASPASWLKAYAARRQDNQFPIVRPDRSKKQFTPRELGEVFSAYLSLRNASRPELKTGFSRAVAGATEADQTDDAFATLLGDDIPSIEEIVHMAGFDLRNSCGFGDISSCIPSLSHKSEYETAARQTIDELWRLTNAIGRYALINQLPPLSDNTGSK